MKPVIGSFNLLAIHNILSERGIVVSNPISHSRNTVRCHGFLKTCCEPPLTTVAKFEVIFLFEEFVQGKSDVPSGVIDITWREAGLREWGHKYTGGEL